MAKTYSPTALIVATLVAVSAVYLTMPAAAPPPHTASQSISELSADRYLKDVTYLASDEMKGRGDGSPELDRAADYIAEQFRLAGLSPAGDANGYFQGFDITTGAVLGAKNEFSVGGAKLRINDDFVPINFSSTAEVEAPLVFAGYGITAPEYKYDDYSGTDASGKIVVVFEREPQENDPKSVFAGTALTIHASFTNKAINARLHGAKGIIFIAPPSQETEDLGTAERQEAESDLGISAVHTKRAFLAKAFKDAGKDPTVLQQAIDKDLTPQSFAFAGAQARIATDVVRTKKTIRNVIGALPGSDPNLKNEWVVVGAHYDHLGLGNRNSLAPSQIGQVHHGADDNASGTAGVMELARIAAKNNHAWKRSALFIAFAGEEIGLLGSSNFANHPTVPVKSIDAMINMDMIGRVSNDRLFIGGIGTSPSLKQTVEDFNKPVGLALNFSDSGYGSSDHTSFNAKKIPVLFFFSGLHTDYHKPSDTSDKINAPGAVKVLSIVYGTVDRLATDASRLPYNEVAQPQQASRGSGGGYGPYFGSVPDFRDDLKGVLFSDVQNNSPAAKAGLKGGDLLVEFDGKPILTLSDYAYALRTKKPGDIVAVVVKRNGQDVKADVTLEARR